MKLILSVLVLFLYFLHVFGCSSRPTLRLYSGYASKGQSHLQPAVRTLQSLLNSRGFSLTVDGYFGLNTEAAVVSWQRSAGLTVDGIVGKNTWSSLCDPKTQPPYTTVITTTKSQSVCSVRPTLKRNAGYPSYGLAHLQWAVVALQRLLTARGFATTADGKFGPKTETAVKRYQTSRGLKPDGVVGKNTWSKLCSRFDKAPPSPAPRPTCVFPRSKCPNGQCKNCREVGTTVLNKMIYYRRKLKDKNRISRIKMFFDVVKTGGPGDLKSNAFKHDCCVRIYKTAVANDVPGNILYGFIGVEVFPEKVLLGAAGYVHVNKKVSIKDALEEWGVDLVRLKFKWCTTTIKIKYPCAERTSEKAWNALLDKWAARDDPKDQAAIKLGFDIARKAAFTRDQIRIRNILGLEVRLKQWLLRKCC